MNVELGRTWKEAVIICFKVLSLYLPVETEKNHKNLSGELIYDSDMGRSKYEAGVLTTLQST
jgi:hypothetical protein